jgi:hypothetical protein
MQPREEALRDSGAVEPFRQMFLQRGVGPSAKLPIVERGARSPNDAEFVGEQIVGIEAVERR